MLRCEWQHIWHFSSLTCEYWYLALCLQEAVLLLFSAVILRNVANPQDIRPLAQDQPDVRQHADMVYLDLIRSNNKLIQDFVACESQLGHGDAVVRLFVQLVFAVPA